MTHACVHYSSFYFKYPNLSRKEVNHNALRWNIQQRAQRFVKKPRQTNFATPSFWRIIRNSGRLIGIEMIVGKIFRIKTNVRSASNENSWIIYTLLLNHDVASSFPLWPIFMENYLSNGLVVICVRCFENSKKKKNFFLFRTFDSFLDKYCSIFFPSFRNIQWKTTKLFYDVT